MSGRLSEELKRRDFLKLAAGASWAVWPRGAWAASHPAEARPWNIIFILADDISVTEAGCYGAAGFGTPNIDGLAGGGVKFETCYATPLCQPTRTELLTGRYGFRTRFYHNWMAPNEPLVPKYKIFAQLLRDAGVATAITGKWHHFGTPAEYGFDQSCLTLGLNEEFRGRLAQPEWIADSSRHQAHSSDDAYAAALWQPRVVKNGELIPTDPDDYGPDICADFIIDFMAKNRQRPFFAFFSTPLVHSPFMPTPDSYQPGMEKNRSDRALNFKPGVEYLDKIVGRITAALERLDLRKRTIIIYSTDNGTPPAKGHAVEEGCRVPLIVNCPGVVKNINSCGELTDFSDLFPTFVELAGGRLPKDYVLDGRSFAPLLLGQAYRGREWAFSYCGDKRILRDKHWLYEGDGRFFYCGDRRDGEGYREVTDSKEENVVAARRRFEKILSKLPAPPQNEPLYEMYRQEERKVKAGGYPDYSIVAYRGMKRPPKGTVAK